MKENTIKQGSKVTLNYRGTLDDGSIFDTSEGREPLSFEFGAGQIIPGLEKGILGLKVSDEKDVTCEPEEAYGVKNPQLVQKVPREMFKQAEEQLKAKGKILERNIVFGMMSPDGKVMHARVEDFNDKELTLDLNHVLAGQRLHFKVEILKVE
ncbi:MAG: peptidylprolyl isomerase [Candidatus Woesearchaeota archaeon]